MKCSLENHNLLAAWETSLPNMVLSMNKLHAEYLHPALHEWPCTCMEGILTNLCGLPEDTLLRPTVNSL